MSTAYIKYATNGHYTKEYVENIDSAAGVRWIVSMRKRIEAVGGFVRRAVVLNGHDIAVDVY